MSNQALVMLDCTLRDGGYYNNWDFDAELVQDYLRAMAAVAVDYVEAIGVEALTQASENAGYPASLKE